ncbi:MAG: TolC family protein [Candidatus Binataceae bacterium]
MRLLEHCRPFVRFLGGLWVLAIVATASAHAATQDVLSRDLESPSRAEPQSLALRTPQADRLAALVDEAMRHSPIVVAAGRRWEAMTRVPIQVATLPDPQVTLQEFTVGGPAPAEGYETSDFYYTGFGVSQDIPWPGKLRSQRVESEHEAEFARQNYEAARRQVARKVRESYFELFFIRKALGIIDNTRDELEQIEQIAETRYRVGQALEQDVIRAQLEMTSILKETEERRQDAAQRQVELKAILGRSVDSADIEVGEVEPTELKRDSPRLAALVGARSPELKMARAMEAKSEEALKLAHQNYVPDFSVGYMYQKTGPGLRDYYMLTLGAKIPLYFWRKQTPAVEQAAFDRDAARNETRARELEIRAEAQSRLIAIETALRVMTLYREGMIPQAEATRAAALSAYRVGKADFQTLISAVIEVLQLNQGYYRALADHEIAVARIQQIIGDMP